MIALFSQHLRERQHHRSLRARCARRARRPQWDSLEDRRLLNAASLDPTFGHGGITTTSFPLPDALSQATSEVVDSTGRIIVAGYYNDAQNNQRVVLARYNPDGSLDTSFGQGGLVYTPIDATPLFPPIPETVSLAIDPQGRILVAGAGTQPFVPHASSAIFDFMVARFSPNGILDTGFGNHGVATLDVGPTDQTSDMPSAIALQPDGKIVVAGTTTMTGFYPADQEFAVARLNANGRLDTSFGVNGWALAAFPDAAVGVSVAQANAMTLEPDGSIVVAGGAGNPPYGVPTEFAVARFHSDGTLDASFGTGGEVVSNLGDTTSTDTEVANAVLLQPDGKIVLGGGQFLNYDSQSNFALLRLNSDGTPDPSFGNDGVVSTVVPNNSFIDSLSGLALQPDGKIVAVGTNFNPSNFNEAGLILAHYNGTDGSLDTSFGQGGLIDPSNPTGGEIAYAVSLQPHSGKIVVAGYTYDPNDYYNTGSVELTRYNTDGSIDPSFGASGKVITNFSGLRDQVATAVATLPGGGIVVAGTTSATINGSTPLTPDIGVAEYNPDGTLNTAFGNDGRVITSSGGAFEVQITAVAVQPDGKIVVAGWIAPSVFNDEFLLLRYNTDGSPDTSFGQGGEVEISFGDGGDFGNGVAIQPDGKIVAVGSGNAANFDVVRLNPNGSLDTSFGTAGEVVTPMNGGASSVVIQPDGKIVVGGTSFSGDPDEGDNFALVRYDADGSLDPSFGAGGVVITGPNTIGIADIALQPDGKIVAVGSTSTFAAAYDQAFEVVRYNSDGSLDQSFGTGGIVTTDVPATVPPALTPVADTATTVVIEADGKIMVGGYVTLQANNGNQAGFLPTIALLRYDTGGSPDPTFGTNGIDLTNLSGIFPALTTQPDGKIIASYTAYINPVGGSDFGVARFLGLDLNITGPSLGVVGENVPFTGSFDDELTADTTGVTWNFGDGTTLTFTSAAAPGALTPTHVYQRFGIYKVTLIVSFASGGTATTSEPVLILPDFLKWAAQPPQ